MHSNQLIMANVCSKAVHGQLQHQDHLDHQIRLFSSILLQFKSFTNVLMYFQITIVTNNFRPIRIPNWIFSIRIGSNLHSIV